MRTTASAEIIPLQQFPIQLRAARRRRAMLNQDYDALELHYLASFARAAEQNMKRVERAPFRLSFVATMVYMLFGRFQIETLGLKFETETGEIK